MHPFANKNIGSKRLFRRKHGASKVILANSTDTIEFTVPYAECKITKAEVMNCNAGDTVDLTIHDTPTGTYSTVPNYQLNQFGFDVFMPDGTYVDESKYDADLYQGMVVRVTYTNSTNEDKHIGINVTLHELI